MADSLLRAAKGKPFDASKQGSQLPGKQCNPVARERRVGVEQLFECLSGTRSTALDSVAIASQW